MITADLNRDFQHAELKPAGFEYEGSDLEAMASAQNYPRWIVDEFAPHLRGSVADIGAGTGNFAHFLLQSRLTHLHAFEPCSRMYGTLSQRFSAEKRFSGVNAYVTDVFSEFEGAFDTVVYNNVMEHVEKDQAELEAVYRMLKPGGKVLIFVPALSWLYSDFDKSLGHFRRYDRSNGCELLLRSGFTVEVAKYVDVLGILPWFVCMKLLKGKLSPGKVSLYDKLGVPLTRAFERIVSPPVGKNLLLVGRKACGN